MSTRNAILKRISISLVLGLLFAWVMAEGAFILLKENNDRAPQRIELMIPAGTAERVAQGQAVPSIPTDMVFVVGDTLVVKNEDTAAHQLGPLWVPPGASASLYLDTANQYSYECSFQPKKSIGLDVRSRTTTSTRIFAILFAGLPTSAMLAVYSFVAFPIKPKTRESKQ